MVINPFHWNSLLPKTRFPFPECQGWRFLKTWPKPIRHFSIGTWGPISHTLRSTNLPIVKMLASQFLGMWTGCTFRGMWAGCTFQGMWIEQVGHLRECAPKPLWWKLISVKWVYNHFFLWISAKVLLSDGWMSEWPLSSRKYRNWTTSEIDTVPSSGRTTCHRRRRRRRLTLATPSKL